MRARRLERSEGLAQGDGQAADLVVAHGLGAAGVAGQAAAGQVGQGVLGERAAGEFAVGAGVVAVAVAQQRAQPVGLRGTAHGQIVACAEQDPQRFAVSVGAGGGEPVGVEAQGPQHGQVRVDRVGLAAPAAASTRSASMGTGLVLSGERVNGRHRPG